MKLVILTIDHMYSNRVVKELLRKYTKDVRLIIEPSQQIKGKSNFQAVLKYTKTSGYYYVIAQISRLAIYKIFSHLYLFFGKNVDSKYFRYNEVAKRLGIKVRRFSDINSKESLRAIRQINPDLIISVLFSQIIKKELLRVPKNGIINFHPAYLPKYKGVSPIFWSLVNGEKYSGATVHYVDVGIDTGRIIARRKIKIGKDDTEDTLYWKAAVEGGQLLVDSINRIMKGKVEAIKNEVGSYFSFPTKSAVSRFVKKGRRFYRIKDLFIV